MWLVCRERNRVLAKETRKKNKQDREDLNREAELLRFQNRMLVQSIKELLELGDIADVDDSNPNIVAIKEVVHKADVKLDMALVRNRALARILNSEGTTNER